MLARGRHGIKGAGRLTLKFLAYACDVYYSELAYSRSSAVPTSKQGVYIATLGSTRAIISGNAGNRVQDSVTEAGTLDATRYRDLQMQIQYTLRQLAPVLRHLSVDTGAICHPRRLTMYWALWAGEQYPRTIATGE